MLVHKTLIHRVGDNSKRYFFVIQVKDDKTSGPGIRIVCLDEKRIGRKTGKSPCLIGNTSSKGPVSIAMLDYRSVYLDLLDVF